MGGYMHSVQPSPLGCPLFLLSSLQQLVHSSKQQQLTSTASICSHLIGCRCLLHSPRRCSSITLPCFPYCTALSDLPFSPCCRLPGSPVVPLMLLACWLKLTVSIITTAVSLLSYLPFPLPLLPPPLHQVALTAQAQTHGHCHHYRFVKSSSNASLPSPSPSPLPTLPQVVLTLLA